MEVGALATEELYDGIEPRKVLDIEVSGTVEPSVTEDVIADERDPSVDEVVNMAA